MALSTTPTQSSSAAFAAALKKPGKAKAYSTPPGIGLLFGADVDAPVEWRNTVQQYTQQYNENKIIGPATARQYDGRGIPVDWNYRTARLDPNGRPLPDGALGWNPQGQPDFGPGIGGWWKRATWKFFSNRDAEADTPSFGQKLTDLRENINTANAAAGKRIAADEQTRPLESLKVLGTAAAGGVGTILSLIGDGWRHLEGDNATILSAIPRVIGTAFDAVGFGFSQLDRFVEERAVGPSILASEELIRSQNVVTDEQVDKWRKWVGPLGMFPVWGAVGAGLITGKITRDEFHQQSQEIKATEASRIAYSMWKDAALKEEFLRRVRAGEDPRLLAMELENPVEEMWAEILFDPTNWIGGVFTKAKAFANSRRAGMGLRLTGELAEHIDDLAKIGKIKTTAEAGQIIENVIRVAHKVVQDTRLGDISDAGKRGLLHLTAPSRQALAAEEVSNAIHHLGRATNYNPEVMPEIIRGLAMFADPDIEKAKEGLILLNRALQGVDITPNVLFSPSMQKMSIVMNDLLEDFPRIEKLFADAGSDTIKLAEGLAGDIEKVLHKRFPVIQDQIKQYDAYKELVKAGKTDEATEFLSKNPLATTAPSDFHRALLKAHEPMQKWFYRPVANVQGIIFMGLNPAYRMRNRFGNFAALFVDEGPVPAFRALVPELFKPSGAIKKLNEWSGGRYIPGSRRGIGAAGSFDPKDWSKGGFNRFSVGAASDEVTAATHIYAKEYPRVIKSVLNERQALAGLSDIITSPDDAKLFVRLVRLEKGDVRKALEAFRNKRGVEMGRDLFFLSERQLNDLDNIGILDEVRAIIKDASLTQDDIVRRLNEVADNWSNFGLRTADEAVMLSMEDDFGKMAANIAADAEEFLGRAGDETSDLFIKRVHADRAAVDAAYQEFYQLQEKLHTSFQKQLQEMAVASGEDVGRATEYANQIFYEISNRIDEQVRKVARTAISDADSFRVRVRGLVENARTMSVEDRIREYKNLTGLSVADAADFTPKKFVSAVWDYYFPTQRQKFIDLRESQIGAMTGITDELHALINADPVVEGARLRATTDSYHNIARLMDRAEIVDGRTIVKATRAEIEDVLKVEYERALAQSGRQGLTGENLVNAINNWRSRGLTPDEILSFGFGDAETTAAFKAVGGPRTRELLEHLLRKSELPEVPAGMTRIYRRRPIGFEEGRSGDLWWSADEAYARQIGEEGGQVVYMDVAEDVWQQSITDAAEIRRTTGGPGVTPLEGKLPDGFAVQATDVDETRKLAEGTYELPVVVPLDEAAPTPARFAHETAPTVRRMVGQVIDGVRENWNRVEQKLLSPEQEAAFKPWLRQAAGRIDEAHFVAEKTATAARDFALHNYGKRYGFDLLAAYIYPYQFWYSRSYAKWMRRAISNPNIASHYFRYRRTMESLHAGLPDWWKYQMNTNELLGMDSESPMWFNLEALFNPLNGLTGIDFTDPQRRKDGWGALVEDLNKMGPSVWAPYQLALAIHYASKGDQEAAARWAGRILPQSRAIRDATALLDPKGLGVEIDPYVNLFGGGIEAYERGRVGRQLGAMVKEKKYTEAELIEAGYSQSGPIWDEARARAINERAPNLFMALSPMLFGAAGKPRSQNDIDIDIMYGQMNGLMMNRPNLSPEEYRQSWDQMRAQYPFLETVLLSKKSGLDRDEALVWSVLGRIPPGMTNELAKQVGLNADDITRFYDTKGDLSLLDEAKRLRLMGSIMELGAVLDVPPNATRAEWNTARGLYRELRKEGERLFGPDIWDQVDLYFSQRDPENPEAGRAFLEAYPIVSQAMDWQQAMIQNNPFLAPYYTSQEKITQFYKQQMYQTAEILFGDDLWMKFDIYSRLKDLGEDKAAKRFWKDNPELGLYMQYKEEQLPVIESRVGAISRLIPEAKQPRYRDGQTYEGAQTMPYNTDEREATILNAVRAYAEQFSNFGGRDVDLRDAIRDDADGIWPGTRSLANRYYDLVSKDPKAAAELLQKNPAMAARVVWEYDRLLRIMLSQAGELYAAASLGEKFPETGQPQQFTGALGRLMQDPEGLPPHIAEAFGINQP